MKLLSRCWKISTNRFALQSGGKVYWQEGYTGLGTDVMSLPPKPQEMPYEQTVVWDGYCYRPRPREVVDPHSEPVVQDVKRYLDQTPSVNRSAAEQQLILELQEHERFWARYKYNFISDRSRTAVVKAWEQVITDVMGGENLRKQAVLESMYDPDSFYNTYSSAES